MRPDEILRQRQEDELEVIRAIYISEVKELTTNKDHTKLAIHLGPQRGCSVSPSTHENTSILLRLTIPAKYPNIVPKIFVEQVKGLTTQEVTELKERLDGLALSNIGQEMVLNLAQLAQDFLYEHQKRPTGSFYDEMLIRHQLQEETTRKKEKEYLEQEVLGIRYEIQKKQELLKEEARTRKEELKQYVDIRPVGLELDEHGASLSSSPSRVSRDTFEAALARSKESRRSSSLRRSFGEDERQRNVSGSNDSGKTVEIVVGKYAQTFQLGEVIDEHDFGYKVYVAMETQLGTLVVVSEWTLNFRNSKGKPQTLNSSESENYEAVSKQLNNMESEVKLFQKLHHPNLVSQIGMTILKTPTTITVYSVQEFVRGMTLQTYFEGTLTMDIPLIRHCALGILNALEFLHSNNVVHRYLSDSSVFLTTKAEVKVGDYGVERKLGEFLRSINGYDAVADLFAPSIGRGAKKTDIYRVGILILSLFKGQRIGHNPPEFPSGLPNEILDFLKKCIDTNENARWTANQLLDHPFLKVPLDKKDLHRLNNQLEHDDDPGENDKHNEEMMTFLSQVVKGHSRLRDEFQIEDWLGKGGFGDVLKVRNKLDGGIYALKRIRLNPRNKQLNRKITREVKLLSRLNHENVVRYYNSWIETVADTIEEEETTSPSNATTASKLKPKGNLLQNLHNSLGITDNFEELVAQMTSNRNSDWGSEPPGDFNEDDSESSSDEEDLFGTSFLCAKDVSEDVVFGGSGSTSPTHSEIHDELKTSSSSSLSSKHPINANSEQTSDGIQREIQFMYIQMEFCEKSTLRTAIDGNLYQDMDRALTLFREVVEGLSHIHQQGMIHRDLKPVNIFLDSSDHVKIGDFGLATTDIIVKNPTGEMAPTPVLQSRQTSEFVLEESLTSNVGTALYVAPELVYKSLQGSKVMYSQKVDIYSLGIVFFEMIYHPIDTGMERVRVITGLRQKEMQFPTDFDTLSMPRQTILLRWLLNHDPRQRPTSLELLQSEYLPPPQMEEAEIHEIFRHTLANSQSKAYKFLISSCFRQPASAAEEITYDMDILRSQVDSNSHIHGLSLMQFVRQSIKKICIQHGAVEVNTPLLLPKLHLYENTSSQVRLMTHSGTLVALHHDLRVPFSRYVVSNSLTSIKRFAIEKVVRERKVFGFHPREFYECAFDIISSGQGSLLAEAETLSIAFEIFQGFSWMREKQFTVRLGHTYLLDAVLIHFSIDEALHSEIKTILTDIKIEKQAKSQVQTRLVSLCLPDQFISMLFTLMDIEGPLPKVSNILKSIVKRNGPAASRIKEGLHELQVLTELIETFGLPCETIVSPTMIFGSNIYSGLIYQITCQMRKKRNRVTTDVVAVGGKYDELLKSLRSTREIAGMSPGREVEQCGVGISLSLDLLVSGFHGEEMKEGFGYSLVDVIVCSLGHHLRTKEKIGLLKMFWSQGISCTAIDSSENLETAEEQCIQLGASIIVVLKEDSFNSNLRVRYLEKQRFSEKIISKAEVVDFILARLSSSSNQPSKTDLQRPAAQTSDSNTQMHQGLGPCLNVSFIITENRDKPANWKRRLESMMIGNLAGSLRKISKQQSVELLGVEVSSGTVKILTSELEISDKEQYNKSVSDILERYPKQRKSMKAICDEIEELVFSKNSEIIIIYSVTDNFYRTLM